LSNTSRVLSFEEGWLASKARKRLGLTLVPHSMVNQGCITIDGLHNVLTTIPTAARKTLMPLDGVIGRELPRIGTVANKRKPGSVEQANSGASPSPAEHAMIEAAIQLDLITPEQAEALVEKGKTLGEWLVEQEKGEAGEPREGKQKKRMDRLWLFALLLVNLVVWAGFGWIVLRVLRSL
jgi:hypothetical protein